MSSCFTFAACGRIGFDASGGWSTNGDAITADTALVDAATTPFLRCDGVDDVVDITVGSPVRIRTLELRVRVPDAAGAVSQNRMLSADRASASASAGIAIDTLNPPLGLRASLAANSTFSGVSGGRTIGTGWMHVALVFDDTTATASFDLYIDGTHDVGTTGPPSPIADFDHAQLCGGFAPTVVFTRVDIDWMRLSSNVRYTGSYSPPASPQVDSNTVMLFDFDGLTFDDRTGTSVANVAGGATIVP